MKNSKVTEMIRAAWGKLGVWLIAILLFVVMSLASDKFLTASNLINVVRQVAVTGIVALGATFVVTSGEIDLSQGGVVCLAGCFCAHLMMNVGMNPWIASIITILLSVVAFIFLGSIVAYLDVPSFIATLGFNYVLSGLVLLLTNSKAITGLPENFTKIARGYIFNDSVPIVAIILLALYAFGAYVQRYRVFGRNVAIVGENRQAALLSGINVRLIKVLAFAVGGACSALAGIVLAARLGSGQPSSGSDSSLMALAAVYVGGASKSSVVNTLAGTLIIGMINNGLNLIGLNASFKEIILGTIIVVAVILDIVRSKRAESHIVK